MAQQRGGPRLKDFFFYGTLLDDDVYGLVTGRYIVPRDRCHAVVDGFRCVVCKGASYPILIPAAGERVAGILVSKMELQEVERLKAFEGQEYELVPLAVHARYRGPVHAQAFMARPWVAGSEVPWSLAAWRHRHRYRDLAKLRALPLWAAE